MADFGALHPGFLFIMKSPLHLLRTIVLFLAFAARCAAAEPPPSYPATAAADLVEAACKKAASESKLVFLKCGSPQCGWCVVFDRYHHRGEVRKILEPHYVIVSIDLANMPDGRAVFSKYAAPQFPTWVIMTPDKRVVVDSFTKKGDPGSNVGYPNQPQQTEYYLAAIKKATPAIADGDLKILGEQIKKAMSK